ncbi:hypothetical protein D6827_00895 [Candidatus Parcubacteria bacterium]|nr:MAG: hypothetical protein D6827_00895 [Candidatus Parcubacteria bacterium]
MNLENKKLEIREKRPENKIDADFDALEALPLRERMDLTRELLAEVFNPPLERADFNDFVQYEKAGYDISIKHFFLPGIYGGEGDVQTIREGYDERANYLATDRRTFLKVGQGEMWILSREKKPYFQISMSECSAVIGVGQNDIIVAHISYSARDQLEAVIRFMREQGVDFSKIYAIASVVDYQKKQAGNDKQRVVDIASYMEFGIPKGNIYEFEYYPDSHHGSVLRNMTQIIGCNDAIFKYSYDLRLKPGDFGVRPQEERIGGYKNEEIIEL